MPLYLKNLHHHLQAGANLVETRPLTGGISAETHLVVFEDAAGLERRWVVRSRGSREMFALLAVLGETAVPAPAPIFF